MSERGCFVTFEGIDGAGKSSQISSVAALLRARGIDLVQTREPGGTPLGESLREMVLDRPMSVATETLLVFAARAEHLDKLIRPALAAGRWVLCDRFTDATYAYQSSGRGVPASAIEALEAWVHPDLQPDMTVLFDLAPELAAARLHGARSPDRFESEQTEFFSRVRAGYLARAQRYPQRFLVIDSGRPPDAIAQQLKDHFSTWR